MQAAGSQETIASGYPISPVGDAIAGRLAGSRV